MLSQLSGQTKLQTKKRGKISNRSTVQYVSSVPRYRVSRCRVCVKLELN